MWVRTCQECNNVQSAKKPDTTKLLTQSYRESLCRKCKSPALDYGKEKQPTPLEIDWSE